MAAQQIVRVQASDGERDGVAGEVGAERVSSTRQPRAAMVGWYQPLQLVRTGISAVMSMAFGQRADRRQLEAMRGALEYFDYSVDDAGARRDELWLDYVADTGDGFDSTYAVARALAADTLALAGPGGTCTTRRGRVLIHGGDLAYPVASRAEYQARLVLPYEQALPSSDAPHPELFAIPGNHDWYDSLVSFTARFCASRWFAGWRTRQRTSYFALQLPHDWWLIGTDVQLDSDLDPDQVAYFRAVAGKMTDAARVILCNAEPHWIYQKTHVGVDRTYADSNLRFLEEDVFRGKVAVFLSGDLHHYRRHADDRGRQKIVAGGGGAFLHPTHDADVAELPGLAGEPAYHLKRSYPDVATSRALTWRNLWFPIKNPWFGVVTAVLYLLTFRAMQLDMSGFAMRDLGAVAGRVVCETLTSRSLVWIVVLIAGAVLFTDVHARWYRVFGGIVHALAHLVAVFFVGWGAERLLAGAGLSSAGHLVAVAGLIGFGGWLAGSLIMGSYLFVSLNGFGHHGNEAFMSLAIADWKNFLRLHIDHAGALRIYPVGIDRVPRRWKLAPEGRWAPDDPRATPARLIEPPIVIPRDA